MRTWVVTALRTVVLLTFAGAAGWLAVLHPGPGAVPAGDTDGHTADARVVEVGRFRCDGTSGGGAADCATVTVETAGGAAAAFTLADPAGLYRDGRRVVVDVDGDGRPTALLELHRSGGLAAIFVAFAVAVVAVAGRRGARSLVGLAVSVGCLLFIVVPALSSGGPVVTTAAAGGAITAVAAMYLTHGFGADTDVAVCATILTLAVAAVAATVAVDLAALTGATVPEAEALLAAGHTGLPGLLTAAILIGALGAVDDLTVSQTVVVRELAAADPGMPRTQLAAAALRVGREHLAATVNTLVFAYAGAALPLMLLLGYGWVAQITSEALAAELVRALAASVSLTVAMPAATLIAVAVTVAGHSSAAHRN